jgi:hypothetical protein
VPLESQILKKVTEQEERQSQTVPVTLREGLASGMARDERKSNRDSRSNGAEIPVLDLAKYMTHRRAVNIIASTSTLT